MKKFKIQKAYLLFAIILGCFVSLAGCSGGGEAGGGEWVSPSITPATPTAIAPTVTAVVPTPNKTAVPINTKIITAAFSRAMAPATLTTTTFKLVCNGNQVTGGGAVTYLAAGKIATLPLPAASNLPIAADCVATVTTGAHDEAGTALAQNYVWNFTTGTSVDTARPRVTITDPVTTVPGPTLLVPANTAISATFNEDMASATITDVLTFTLTGPGVTPVVGMAIPVTYNVASKTAVFRPLVELTPAVIYTATIKGTGIHAAKDLTGNRLAGDPLLPLVDNDYVWQFTTIAPAPPAPVSVLPPTSPAADASGVCPSSTIQASFSVPSGLKMDPDTLNTDTFIVTGPGPTFTPVDAATVSLDVATGKTATFTPLNPLVNGTIYTATIKGGLLGVKDLAIPTANQMTDDYTWNFTAGPATGICQPVVNPGTLATFGVASYGGIFPTGATLINGDVVLDPTAECNNVLVGNGDDFGLCGGTAPTNNVGDKVITPDYPDTTTAHAVMAALLAKWGNISPAQTPGATVLGCGVIGSTGGGGAGIGCAGSPTLTPGVYISATGSSIGISGDLTLDGQGNQDATFIFQAPSSTVITEVNSEIILTNGAKASNIWWYVGSSATIKGGSIFQGNILASASISMGTSATSCGRLLAGAEGTGAFTFLANTVSVPGHAFAPPGCE